MPRDVQTSLTIAAQTKGFEKAQREILGISQKSLEGLQKQSAQYSKVQQSIGGMREKLGDLAKQQIEAGRQMAKMADQGSEAYKQQEERMKSLGAEASRLRREIKLLEQAHRGDAEAHQDLVRSYEQAARLQQEQQQASRGAFTQGLIQTAMPGMASMFMQRGPGMGRQFAGQMVGGAIGRMGRGAKSLAGAMFTGIEGLQQGIADLIPVAGEAIAGQVGALAGYSERSLGWERQRLQMAPYIGANQGRMAGIRRRGAEARQFESRVASGEISRTIARERAGAEEIGRQFGPMIPGISGAEMGQKLGRFWEKELFEYATDELVKAGEQRTTEGAQRAAARRTPFRQAGALGRQYAGLGREESAQAVAQLYQVSGGRFEGTAGQGRAVGAAMAAQTLFGVGPEAAGGFMLGGRRGGVVGGGPAPELLTDSIKDALQLGLEGAEITQYVQQTAQGIQAFQQTGIPINQTAIKSMASEISEAGIGGVRASTLARGFQNYAQQLAQRGPQSGLDIFAMTRAGGYRGGGGGEFVKSLLQMEQLKEMAPGDIKKGGPMGGMLKDLIEMGGGGLVGTRFLHQAMQRMGMQVSLGETVGLAERLTGQQFLTEEERETYGIGQAGDAARRARGKKRAAELGGPEGMMAEAAKEVSRLGPHLRRQAAIMDRQLDLGAKFTSTVQTLNESTTKVNTMFEDLAGEHLKDFANLIADAVKTMVRMKEEGIFESIINSVAGAKGGGAIVGTNE
jgi:hypothetical protein